MSTTLTVNSLAATIPALTDTANVVTAFTDYHTSMANTSTGVAVLNRVNTFANDITFTGDIIVNGGDVTTSATTFNLLNSTVTTMNFAGAGTTVNIGATTGVTNIKNNLVLAAGTTSLSPLKFTSGTNLTNIAAGSMEYDGNVFYGTPKVNNTTAGRGVLPTQYVLAMSTTPTDSVSSSTSATKTSAALGKYIYLAASTTYKVDFSIKVYHSLVGTPSSSINFRFAVPSGTIAVDLNYRLDLAGVETSSTSATSVYETSSVDFTIKSVSSASDTGYSIINGSGLIRTGVTAGNAGPTFYMSVTGSGSTSSASFTTQSDSYCIIQPLGSGTGDINQGGWA